MHSNDDAAAELWRHASPDSTRMWEFKELVNKKYNLTLDSYNELYQWSIDNIASFWEETWNFTGIKVSKKYNKVNTSHSITCFSTKLLHMLSNQIYLLSKNMYTTKILSSKCTFDCSQCRYVIAESK